VHDARSIRFALLAALAVAAVASSAAAMSRCEKPCKAETAACIRSRCSRSDGDARRQCSETCRGIGGCAPIRTLAYVVTECRTDSPVARQKLVVRRGNCAPVPVMELTGVSLADAPPTFCGIYGDSRLGHAAVLSGFFQRLAVTADGSAVVFEVTDQVAQFPTFTLPSGIEEGFYFVRADGTGLRRLGPASGMPLFVFFLTTENAFGFDVGGFQARSSDISPDGRSIVFTDLGPGPAGEQAIQVVMLDLATGKRRLVTSLPAATSRLPNTNATEFPRFVDKDTILFVSWANPDGMNPDHYYMFFTVHTDGTGLRAVGTPTASAGSRVLPKFSIAGGGTNLMNMVFLDGSGERELFQELFILDGTRFLQLTDYRRSGTGRRFLTADGRRAFFATDADPLRSNPSGNCQLFSVDTLGSNLRQVTGFREGERSLNGCNAGPPPGCTIWDAYQDPITRTVVFYSSCDPFGTNPYGSQIFAMRPDGTRLRQLTATRGRVLEDSGAVTVELPGPTAYSARPR
jgi:hypothetical protein